MTTSRSDGVARFPLSIDIAAQDIDDLGHVNNLVYMRWVQDVALAHWHAVAAQEHRGRIAWVAIRHEIDYKHPARLGDGIAASTWIGVIEPHRCERFVEIRRSADGKLLASSRTLWCPVDRHTGKLVRVGPEVRALFAAYTVGASDAAPADRSKRPAAPS